MTYTTKENIFERTVWSRRGVLSVMVTAVLLAACSPTRGCAESQFALDPASRLPGWFVVEQGQQRGDYSVGLTYYTTLWGAQSARFDVMLGGGTVRTVFVERSGPSLVGPPLESGHTFKALTFDGITEVIEHQPGGRPFRINDSPAVRSALGLPPK